MTEHRLIEGVLIATAHGIAARCTCGWRSVHFTSLSASAAFQDHQEEMAKKDKDNDR